MKNENYRPKPLIFQSSVRPDNLIPAFLPLYQKPLRRHHQLLYLNADIRRHFLPLKSGNARPIPIKADKEITPETIRKHLYHPEVPDVDMLVRTSGEKRISGFMLWRVAYAELMFIDKYFPEMKSEDIDVILKEYEKRNRRFGK